MATGRINRYLREYTLDVGKKLLVKDTELIGKQDLVATFEITYIN